MNFDIIKTTDFSYNAKDGSKAHGKAFTVGYKGRAIQVSSLDFSPEELSVDGNKLTVKGDLELKQESFTNLEGKEVTTLKLKPRLDLVITKF